MWVASFDIGKKNFSFYIEEFDEKKLSALKCPSKKQRYNKDGSLTSKMEKVLQKVYMNGKTILHTNLDITENCVSKIFDPELYYNMTSVLDQHKEYFDKCSIFVIENQMMFGRKMNYIAYNLGIHCASYFRIVYNKFKIVVNFPAYHKTQILGAPKEKSKTGRWKEMTKYKKKKWCAQEALRILQNRKEEKFFNQIKTARKKDDLGDTLTQLQAFKFLSFVAKEI